MYHIREKISNEIKRPLQRINSPIEGGKHIYDKGVYGSVITADGVSQNFLFEFERAVLIALKEEGVIDELQYSFAEEKLKTQKGRNKSD